MCKVEKYWIEIVRLNSTHSSGVIFGERQRSVVGILSIPMASCTEFFLSGPEGLFPEPSGRETGPDRHLHLCNE